jgi:hypothetical protein
MGWITPLLDEWFPSNKMQSDQRNEIKQHYPYLIDGHGGVVDRVKGFGRYPEPAAVKAVQPVMGEFENNEPDDKDRVVDQGTEDEDVQGMMVHVMMASGIGL